MWTKVHPTPIPSGARHHPRIFSGRSTGKFSAALRATASVNSTFRTPVEDLDSGEVVENAPGVKTYPHQRLGIVCQSTTPPRLATEVNAAIRSANPGADIQFIDTICQPTRDRQGADSAECGRLHLPDRPQRQPIAAPAQCIVRISVTSEHHAEFTDSHAAVVRLRGALSLALGWKIHANAAISAWIRSLVD